jgi:DDE superfamily endonuclease
VTGSKLPAVQRLQFFLSESVWDPGAVNDRRLDLLRADPATAPHGGGVLVIDDSGDRKDGTATAHVGRQYLGRYGKTDNGVVTVTTVWADERVYYPVHAVPYTPAKYFAKGKNDPEFRTKLAIGADLAIRARAAGFTFRAVVADSAYGDQDGFRAELAEAGLPFVMALRPQRGTWARAADAHTPVEAARALAWGGPEDPGDWHPVTRTFRDGHAETWRAADASLGGWGPDGVRRLVVATADPGTLPDKATWYLVTNLARPGGPREEDSPWPAAGLAEIVRLYAIRNWIEQSYKQVKDELGWADFQVRSDIAIRRHQVLVNCAFSFCWDTWFTHPGPPAAAPPASQPGGGERGSRTRQAASAAVLAPGTARRARLARPVDRAAALVDRMVERAPAPAAASPDDIPPGRPRPAPLHPELTDYR